MAEKELKSDHLQVSERLTVEKLPIYWEKNPAFSLTVDIR